MARRHVKEATGSACTRVSGQVRSPSIVDTSCQRTGMLCFGRKLLNCRDAGAGGGSRHAGKQLRTTCISVR